MILSHVAESVTIAVICLLALNGLYRLLCSRPRIEVPAAPATSYRYPKMATQDTTDTFEIEGLRAYTLSKAGSAVNYDFFDVQNHCKNVVTFYLGDVSGKGESAADCRSACRSLLKHAARISLDPAGVVAAVNETLASYELDGRYATLLYGRLDLTSGRLLLLSAGHPNPIRISRRLDRTQILECSPCLPVGILTGHDYVVSGFSLLPGDTLLLYTDGITEARDSNRQFFGEHNLMQVAHQAHSPSPQALVDSILRRVDSFSPILGDDRTVMAITYVGLRSEYSTNRMEVNPAEVSRLSLCYN